MKRRIILLTVLLAAAAAAIAAAVLLSRPKVYMPQGDGSGDAALDAAVDAHLQTLCAPGAALEENLGSVYDWVRDEITYRPGAEDTAGGFTDALTAELAMDLLHKRRGNCDGEAALMAVLLRRMGCEAVVVQGRFAREDGQAVEHAWVIARVDGAYRHFDPLYERYYTENAPRSCFMGTDADFEATHSWQRDDYPACG